MDKHALKIEIPVRGEEDRHLAPGPDAPRPILFRFRMACSRPRQAGGPGAVPPGVKQIRRK
jgi:hypothetical protein